MNTVRKETTINKQVSTFCSDYFFHYLIYHCPYLRLKLCQYLSHNDLLTTTTIINNDTYGHYQDSRKYVMDIVVKDNFNQYYNFEMQNGAITEKDLIRFQLYAMRLIEKQIQDNQGDSLKIKQVKQLILYTGKPIRNFLYYQHHAELFDKQHQVLLERGLLSIRFIQTQGKEETDMELQRNEIYEVFQLFGNEENRKKTPKSRLAQEVLDIYDHYLSSDDYLMYCTLDRDRRYIQSMMQEAKAEGEEKGIEKGIEKGSLEGKRNTVQILLKQIYLVNDLDWLKQCNMNQLDKIIKLSVEKIDYECLKNMFIE